VKDSNNSSKQDINFALYNKYYDKPSWWFNYRYRTRIKDLACHYFIKKIFQREKGFNNRTILEVGFGHGDVLLSFNSSNKILGSELSESAISNASRKAEKLGFTDYFFYSVLKYPVFFEIIDNADLVIASHVLEHVDDDFSMTKDIYRLLNPGGYFIVLVPVNEYQDDPNHVRKYSLDSCINLFLENGFSLVEFLEFDHAFTLFEKVYWKRFEKQKNSFLYKINWKIISLFMGFWSFQSYRKFDNISSRFFKAKPHQIGLLLQK